jgi:CTP:molybdopterin cytidylyltransferase MocA
MLAGIILAAGASSRMGRVKALLPSGDGRTFLARLAATLADAGADPLVVVTGPPHSRLIAAAVRDAAFPLVVALNAAPERGQLSSLVAGLDLLAGQDLEGAIVTPVDYPLVSAATVRRLVEAWRVSGAPVARPGCGGAHGHPVIFAARLFDELRSADLSLGARAVIARHAAGVLDVAVDDPGAFEDIDTPEDYRRLIGQPI